MKYFRKLFKEKTPGDEIGPENSSLNFNDFNETGSHSSPEDLSVSLRAEMLPASRLSPDIEAARFTKFNPRKLLAVAGFMILIAVGWLFYAGSGRPVLERLLSGIANLPQAVAPAVNQTSTATDVAAAPTSTVQVMKTPTRTPTPFPSATAVSIMVATATSEPSQTPTSSSECIDVLAVSLEDVGKTLCVRGVIENFEARSSGFLIAFGNQKGAMYWVSYDLVWEPAKKGLCVEITGEVMQIASSPVIVFGYQNLPEVCPVP